MLKSGKFWYIGVANAAIPNPAGQSAAVLKTGLDLGRRWSNTHKGRVVRKGKVVRNGSIVGEDTVGKGVVPRKAVIVTFLSKDQAVELKVFVWSDFRRASILQS